MFDLLSLHKPDLADSQQQPKQTQSTKCEWGPITNLKNNKTGEVPRPNLACQIIIGFIASLDLVQPKGQSPPSEELLGVVDVEELVRACVRTRVCMEFRKWRPNETRCSYLSTPRIRPVSL